MTLAELTLYVSDKSANVRGPEALAGFLGHRRTPQAQMAILDSER
jgi:hypothetical protein